MSVVGFGGRRVEWQGLWDETFSEDIGWLRTSSGMKNGVFKLIPTVLSWYKECSGEPLSHETKNLSNFLRDCKNVMALGDIPEKTSKYVSSIFKLFQGPRNGEGFWGHVDLGWRTATGAAGVIAPIYDVAEAIDARVFSIDPKMFQQLKNLNAISTIIASTDGVVKNITRIFRATHALDAPRERADVYELGWRVRQVDLDGQVDPDMVIALSLIDLAKCISYLVLGTILFITGCIVVIPSASFWILVSSSSGLAFTIIGEFYQRYCRGPSESYRYGNPRYPHMPDVTVESEAERRARLRIRH